jgi:hypothetical protein
VLLGLMLLVTAGCAAEEPDVPLCDGSDGLTLRIFAAGQASRDAMGSAVRVENGLPSFAVDGQCRYFMGGGWRGAGSARQSRDEGWRRGTVSDGLRRDLELLVGWADLEQRYACDPSAGAFDAPAGIVANTHSASICASGSVGPQFAVAFDAIQDRAAQLWAQAQPLDQDLRVTAVEDYVADGDPLPAYAWPSGLAFRDYLLQDDAALLGVTEGFSKLVPAAEAGPLREVRERFLLDLQRRANGIIGGIQMTDGETTGAVYLRDALPYEDEDGLWPLPGEAR